MLQNIYNITRTESVITSYSIHYTKLYENLFFAGEMIDLDAPTGGYNLQLCWSTGYLAGVSAATEA